MFATPRRPRRSRRSTRHVLRVVDEYVAFYNGARCHQGTRYIPDPYDELREPSAEAGRIVALPVLGGVQHDYRLEQCRPRGRGRGRGASCELSSEPPRDLNRMLSSCSRNVAFDASGFSAWSSNRVRRQANRKGVFAEDGPFRRSATRSNVRVSNERVEFRRGSVACNFSALRIATLPWLAMLASCNAPTPLGRW